MTIIKIVPLDSFKIKDRRLVFTLRSPIECSLEDAMNMWLCVEGEEGLKYYKVKGIERFCTRIGLPLHIDESLGFLVEEIDGKIVYDMRRKADKEVYAVR